VRLEVLQEADDFLRLCFSGTSSANPAGISEQKSTVYYLGSQRDRVLMRRQSAEAEAIGLGSWLCFSCFPFLLFLCSTLAPFRSLFQRLFLYLPSFGAL
jgi:hypothetical protein